MVARRARLYRYCVASVSARGTGEFRPRLATVGFIVDTTQIYDVVQRPPGGAESRVMVLECAVDGTGLREESGIKLC